MALATQCPHCHTTFRVASDQLKLRGGIVRCGACQRIFDGSAHLVDLDALAASKPAAPPAPEASAAFTAPADTAAPPVYALDFDATLDPLGILPKAENQARAQDPEPPHGDVLAGAVDAVAASGVDLPAADDADGDASAAQESPQDPEPPHGDVLAHALDTVAEPETHLPASPAPDENVQDPERPHGDALAHALGTALDTDARPGADLPPPDAPATGRARDPEPPHGDVLDHAVEAGAASEPDAPAAPAAPPLSFAPQGRIEPSFDLPVDEELVAQALPGHEPDPEARRDAAPLTANADTPPAALPLRASAGGMSPSDAIPFQPDALQAPKSARARALEARTRRTKMTPTRIEAPKLRVPETDEPEFVKRSRKQEQSGRTRRILMGAGAAVLLLVLAAQLVLNFRNVLAARYPGARPALGAACALLGCRVELPTQIDNLAIETGELSTLGPDTYSLNTLLRNQGSLVQAWPSIELELTDANDKPVLRRVFAPADYLPQGASAPAGFGGRSEQAVRLHFALTDLKPSGYHIAVFYP
jgi:predicted Zn finger-like uncharacterized protein